MGVLDNGPARKSKSQHRYIAKEKKRTVCSHLNKLFQPLAASELSYDPQSIPHLLYLRWFLFHLRNVSAWTDS